VATGLVSLSNRKILPLHLEGGTGQVSRRDKWILVPSKICLREQDHVFSVMQRSAQRSRIEDCIQCFEFKSRFRESYTDFKGKGKFICSHACNKSRDSSVGMALGYVLNDRGSRFRFPAGAGNFLLNTASRTALGPTQPPIQCVPGALSLGVKRPSRVADHSPPSSAEVKE
jgi:hypothetical protein